MPAVLVTLGPIGQQEISTSFGLDPASEEAGLRLCDRLSAGGTMAAGEDAGGRYFFAGVALRDSTGGLLGVIALADALPRAAPDADDQAVLLNLASLAGDRIARIGQTAQLKRQVAIETLRARLLAATVEAANFTAAIAGAAKAIMEATQATTCSVFRLAPDQEAVLHIHSAGHGFAGHRDHVARILRVPLTIHNSEVGAALASGQTRLTRDLGTLDLDRRPAIREVIRSGLKTQIILPVDLSGDRHAFSIGLQETPEDCDGLMEILRHAAGELRIVLRRMRDQEETALFRRAVEVCPDAVMITEAEPFDPPGPRILYVNEAFTRVTGYTAEEVIGQTPRILQGQGTSAEARAFVKGMLSKWRPVRQEILNYRKDGTPIWLDMNIAPVADASGWYTHWVSVERDVTQRHVAERQREQITRELELLISAMPGVLQRIQPRPDGSWDAVFSAPAIEALTGFTPAEIAGNGHRDHFSEADMQMVRECMQIALEVGESALEAPFRRRDGRKIILHAAMRANRRLDGVQEIIVVWTDVTIQREQAWQVAQANRLSTLGEMATGIAHELNQPLTAIPVVAEVALMKLDQPVPDIGGARERVERMAELAMRAAAIIKNLRDFATDRGSRNVPVRLEEAVTRTRLLVERMIVAGGIQLDFDIAADLPPVLGDLVRIEQVLVNLLLNARDALEETRPAAPRIVVTMARDTTHGRVEIADNAGGIAPEIMDRLFDPFFTTKGPDRGTGLGLSISRAAMTTMGGEISVRNGREGAVFTLLFATVE